MGEPTSSLSFGDLKLEVAIKLGIARYGTEGTEAASIPTDAHDLALVERLVNNGLRMFIADAPKPNGWRWTKRINSIVLWPDDVTSDLTISNVEFVDTAGRTLVEASDDVFYESMEMKTIDIDTVGEFIIDEYVSATRVWVVGDASAASADDFTIESSGNYTMPIGFGGQFTGKASYAQGTDRGMFPDWSEESIIRSMRADSDSESGTPNLLAIRIMDHTLTARSKRKRWELMVYPLASELVTVEFPFIYHFDRMVNDKEALPAPFGHDEAIKSACRAAAEKDQEDTISGPEMQYYRTIALPNSHAVDAMSAPKRLGYCGDGRQTVSFDEWRANWSTRPTVSVNP